MPNAQKYVLAIKMIEEIETFVDVLTESIKR